MTKANAAPLRLLVVDDHAAFRATVRQVFDSEQVVISEASSGEEAVARFTAETPDWVIMDFRMPGMGGLKATEAILQSDPAARIVILSQFHEPEYAEQAREAGAVAFFNKENLPELPSLMVRAESLPANPRTP